MYPRSYLMTTLAFTLVLIRWLAPSSIAQETKAQDKKAISVADTSNPESWRERYAYSLGVQAYAFGFPYINLPTYRWKWVTQAPPAGPSQSMTPYAAINHFFHFRSLADASYRGGGGPNNDTFYSSAWVDLKDGPVIMSHPDLGNRYFIFQMACTDGDNFAAVGSRPTGSKAGHFAIIGPNWKGDLPSGVTALPHSRSNSVYLLGRTLVDGPADAEAVRKLQDQYTLTPLNLWGKAGAIVPESRDVWEPFDNKTDPLADWKTMNRAMTEDPPEERLAKLLGLFARVGIGPGQDVEAQDEATKRGLAKAAIDGRQLILDVNRSKNPFMGDKINGWSIPPATFGRYGLVDDFLLRAVLCHAGIITPWAEDAYATNTTTDINGDIVDGSKRYVIHFAPDKMPKVHGFWSLTLYDSTFNLTPNPINRYSIGNRTEGLKLDADGGLTVYLQHESPGTENVSNWLPTPPSGIFTLTFRAYWPDKSVAEEKWSPPGVMPESEQETIDTLQLAYRWGYPLMAMAMNNRETYSSTINAFYNMKTAADEKSQRDKGFNAETLYSAGALDLSKEPMVFNLPKVGDRYVVFPIQDAWGNIDNVIGTRTEGNQGGTYLISGPGWQGTVPKGVKHFRVHTNVAFLPGRSMVRSPEDAKSFAETVQDQFTLTPLSRWGKGTPNPNRDSLKDPLTIDPSKNYNSVLTAMPINDYFNQLNDLLVTNPPYDYDKPVLERFAKLGIGPGLKFDFKSLNAAVRAAMEEFSRTDVPASAKMYTEKGQDYRLNKLLGHYGTAYYERYYTLFGGLGSNLMEDAAYFFLNKDESGAKLDGNKKYVVRLETAQIPKTKAFWSLTLYDKDFYLPQGLPMRRHVRNSMNGMKLGEDGSLTIYLQPESPGADQEDNWLPTPRDNYFVVLRVYGPEGDVLTDKWQKPAVREVK